MTRFEGYRWEDHAPRPGRWRIDLGMTILSIGLLFVAFPDAPPVDFPTFSAGIDQPAPAASKVAAGGHWMAEASPRLAARASARTPATTSGATCPESGPNIGS